MISIIANLIPTIAFVLGFCLGFSIKKNDKLPEIKTPTEIVKDIKEQKEVRIKKETTDQYLENIDNYPFNQKDIKE